MTQIEISKIFGVSQRLVSDWKKKGAPLNDVNRLAEWVEKNSLRRSAGLRNALRRIRKEAGKPSSEPAKRKRGRPKKKGPKIKRPTNEKGRKSLEAFRDFYVERLGEAQDEKRFDDIKYWNELLLKTEKCIRESEAHIKKLGIDSGEMLSRGEVERILKAIIYAGNACIRKQLKEVCEAVAECGTANEVYELLPAVVLGGRIFEGVKAVSKSPSGVTLPDWVVECMTSEGENYFDERP